MTAILGRQLTSRERDLFDKYLKILIRWQKVHRLVGSVEPVWIVEHLFLDSLLFLRLLPSNTRSVLDLGSGAGLPGVPIKIVRSEVEVTLLESRRRRASFLSAVVRELSLDGLRVIADRVEDRLGELEGRYDAVVMRCAGNLDQLIPIAARLVVPQGGVVIGSGPPRPRPLAHGEWVTIPGLEPGATRRFAVYRQGGPSGKV
ncbi:MAG TPA: 16S rRNA (guanine(527)-N(7))-methyltransferase RsmG [Gaiellaceae bacterium]|nr:16S rRNA (guanine(527)-N(7))-methyltransferase RsmG [Gaiellaceae bacterium]